MRSCRWALIWYDWSFSFKDKVGRRWPCTTQDETPRESPTCWRGLLSQASCLKNCEKINSCSWSHPVCGTWLWWPKQANTLILYRSCFKWRLPIPLRTALLQAFCRQHRAGPASACRICRKWNSSSAGISFFYLCEGIENTNRGFSLYRRPVGRMS